MYQGVEDNSDPVFLTSKTSTARQDHQNANHILLFVSTALHKAKWDHSPRPPAVFFKPV